MRVLRIVGLLVIIALSAAAPVKAQDTADAGAIRAVIEQQLAAFQRDDGAAAFGFAAPSIQEHFGTADNFMQMVRSGYQPVYRPREVAFGALTTVAGNLVQRVLLVGPDGVAVVALYTMERQADGGWKVAACYLTISDDKAT
jgi:ketosteroid isomerase-like protein